MKKESEFSFPTPEDGGSASKRVSVPYFWQGGAEGAETNWNEPLNWYNRFVPGWFDVVVISGAATVGFNYPVIHDFANDISQLIIEEEGRLTIGRHGKLCVDGLSKKGLGIMNEGEIFIQGELTVHRTLFASVRNKGFIFNSGSVALEKHEDRGIIHSVNGKFENIGELLFL